MEPNNPDKYYIYRGYETVDGKYGYAVIKKWFDTETGKSEERILSFDKETKGDEKHD